MSIRFAAGSVLIGLIVAIVAVAGEKGTASESISDRMSARIDELLAARWKDENVQPAGACSDAEFLRRAYLDLTGRIPRVGEARAFLTSKDADRRAKLIDQLLGLAEGEFGGKRPQHATHFANTWRRFLLPENVDARRFGFGLNGFETWLRDKFADNAPYDETVRELLLAEGQINQPGPVLFYSALQVQPEELASATSRAFLGVQISCAQCHDHPFDHWKQRDFWGYAAFFARMQRPAGNVQFVAQVRDADTGEVKLPETDDVVPPRFLEGDSPADGNGKTRRQLLAEWMTSPDNPFFARAAVNRVWATLFGRGIVDPVDDLGAHNPPSHPELLSELAAYFVQTGFDVRNLIRVIAGTSAYQLASASPQENQTLPELFARMAVKSLTAEQLYDCLATATCRRAGTQPVNRFGGFNGYNDQSRQAFLLKFAAPAGEATDYHGGILQALTLMNGGLTAGSVNVASSDVLLALDAPFFSGDDERVDTLFLAALSRFPSADERERFVDYVSIRSTEAERKQAMSDILWALLNSAEFTLNH